MSTPLNRSQIVALGLLVAIMVVAPGCKKKTGIKGKSGAAAVSAPATLATLQVPKQVVAFGGTDSLAKLLEGTAAAGKDLHPMAANISIMGQALLQQGLGLTSPAGLDLTGPMRFALVDPKKYESGPVILVLKMATQEKFVASLPATKKEKDQGNAYSCVPMGGQQTFFNFMDGYVVATHQPKLFAEQKGAIEKLIAAKGQVGLEAVLEAGNLYALYKGEMAAAMAEMEAGMAKNPMGNAQAEKGIAAVKKVGGWSKEVAQETERLVVGYQAGAEGLRLTLAVKPQAGTDFLRTLKALEGKGAPAIIDRLPAETSFFAAGRLDPDKTGELIERLMRLSMMMMPSTMPDSWADASKKFWKATNGEFATGLYTAPEGGLALVGLYKVTDLKTAQASMKQMLGLYKDKAYVEMMKEMKMEVEFKEAAYNVGDVPVTQIGTKMGAAGQGAGFAKLISSMTTTHIALTKEQGVYAFGPSAKLAMEAFLSGKVKGGLAGNAGVKKAMTSGAPGATFWMYGALGDIVKEVFRVMGADPSVLTLPEAKDGACISFGSADGQLNGAFDLPMGQIKVIGAAMKQMGGALGR